MQPVKEPKEELDEQVNVLRPEVLALTGLSRVGEGDFHVDVVSGLIEVGRFIFGRVDRSLGGSFGRRLALVDPSFSGIAGRDGMKARRISCRDTGEEV